MTGSCRGSEVLKLSLRGCSCEKPRKERAAELRSHVLYPFIPRPSDWSSLPTGLTFNVSQSLSRHQVAQSSVSFAQWDR